jgi:hypothetical protein
LIRGYLAKKNEFFDRAAEIPETPSAPSRYGLSGRVVVDFTEHADSLDPGETLAQDARCPAERNTLMSPPVSATNTSALSLENPGMLNKSSRPTRNRG